MTAALVKLADGGSLAWQWTRFALRTAGYASLSCLCGPLTKGRYVSQELFRRWCRASVRQMGITIEATGGEQTGQYPAVLVSNHLSSLDIPVLGLVLAGDYRWVAKRELLRVPFVGWHLRLAGHIPVDRKGGRPAMEDLNRRFHRVFAEGASVLLFPEGTRSKDGALQPFKMGAFFAAVQNRVPVIPVVVSGTERIAKKGTLTLDPNADRRVRVRVLDPIQPPETGDEQLRAKQLRDATRQRIVRALDELRGDLGAALRPTLPGQ